jgi:putative FmdB family regulatory protein
MPIYEYRCRHCGRRTTVFTRSINEQVHAVCEHCGSDDLRRLISRVAVVRSEESRLESLADPSTFGDLDENDPRSLGRFMRRMSQELGEDLGPEFDEVVDRLEAGQSPEEIEKSMPELSEGLGDESSTADLD